MSNQEEIELSHLIMDLADRMADGAQPSDPRSWRHLLVYCPRELIEARLAELDRRLLKRITGDVNAVAANASAPGEYDRNPYMHGMADGLRLAQAIVNRTEPEYLDPPAVWLDDKKGKHYAEIVGDMGAALLEVESTPQGEGKSSGCAGAYEPDREARAGAGGDNPKRDQPRGRTPPDGALC